MATVSAFSAQSGLAPTSSRDDEDDLKAHPTPEDATVYLSMKESLEASSRSNEVDSISGKESIDSYPTTEVDSVARYFRRLEERVNDLENQITILKGSGERLGPPISAGGLGADKKLSHSGRDPYGFPPPTSLDAPRSRTSTTADPAPLRMDRAEFESPTDMDPIHAVELLVEQPTPPPSSSMIKSGEGTPDSVLRMRIRSEQLLEILHDVIGPALFPLTYQSVVILRPFKVLILHQVELRKKMDSLEFQVLKRSSSHSGEKSGSDGTISAPELDTLLSQLKSLLDIVNNVIEANLSQVNPVVSFIGLWHIFLPGDIVIHRDGDITNAFRIRSTRGGSLQTKTNAAENSTELTSNSFILDCFYLDYNGKRLGPVQKEFTIHHFLGQREILKLPVIPTTSARHGSRDIRRLVERGRKFYHLSKGPQHQFYSGLSLDSITEQVDGNVVVDLALYYRQNPDAAPIIGLPEYEEPSHEEALLAIPGMCQIPNCDCGRSVIKNGIYDDRKVDKVLTERFLENHADVVEIDGDEYGDGDDDALTAEQLMLLPSLVWGFDLRKRKWNPLDISLIKDVTFASDAFDDIVLPTGHKEVLASLVTTFPKPNGKENDTSKVDLVPSKGNGLIILLHGGPGVGKTSTAECLAEYAHRPLLPITSADIGQTAYEVEQNLETFFSLSQRWGCVLLFDEADILLQARDRANLQRNAIVSIFLRILEYYTGILIMTTNRVGTFDEAFKSRIHVVLHFPPLNLEDSLKIWDICFRRLRRQNPLIKIDPQIMKYLGKGVMQQGGKLPNGRSIRNAVQSAATLAKHSHKNNESDIKEVYVKLLHIEAILDLDKQFDQYMYAVYGGADDIRAKRMGDRNDDDWDRPKYVSRAAARPKQSYTTSRQGERLFESRRDSTSLASLDSD